MKIAKEVLHSFKNCQVVVTGGTGLIGRQVVDILVDVGASVCSVSHDNLKFNAAVDYIFGDLTDFSLCKQMTSGVDFVFHIAGIKGSVEVTKAKPASFFVPLLQMNTNLLEACRLNKVKKIVYASSIGAYSAGEVFTESEDIDIHPPMDLYPGWAKRVAEMQIQTYKIQYGLDNFSIVRPCNVYGPGDNFDPDNAMVIPSLMYRIYHGEDPIVVWGDGSAIRDFAFSRDIAEGIILALYHGTGSRYINLGSGKGYSIRKLVEILQSIVPFNYMFDKAKSSGFSKRVMDISMAIELLGYYPSTSLLDGLKQTWDWYIENQDEYLQKVNYFREQSALE